MSSKIYNKYLELKSQDSKKLYLFHTGKFYIFLADDVEAINQYVVLRKIKFTKSIDKCGFPDNSLQDYMRVFKNHQLNIEIIESDTIDEVNLPKAIEEKIHQWEKIKAILKNVEIEKITPLEAMDVLNHLMRCLDDERS